MFSSSSHEEEWVKNKMQYLPDICPSCGLSNSLIPSIKGEPGLVFSKLINEKRLHLVDSMKHPKENSYCKNCKQIAFIEIIEWDCKDGHGLRYLRASPYPIGDAVCDICDAKIGSSRTHTYEGYNCITCKFDICMGCYRQGRPRKKI